MRYSDLNVQTTNRPEQFELQSELKKLGIESELEYKILRDEYRCKICTGIHGSLEELMFHRGRKHEDIYFTNAVIEQKYYQYDLVLSKYRILIELNGSIHKKRGVMRHDELKLMFAESKGYELLSFSSRKKPYKIALEIAERVHYIPA